MKEIIMARNVQNTIAIQQNNEADPLSINDNDTGPSSSSNNSSFQNAFNQLKNYELPGFQKQISIDQVNLTDLDLNIPVSSSGKEAHKWHVLFCFAYSFLVVLGGRKVYQDGEDEYPENDEDEECLLFKLWSFTKTILSAIIKCSIIIL